MPLPSKKPLLKQTQYGVPRKDLRLALKKTRDTSATNRMLNWKDRVKLEKELFPKQKYGSYVNEMELNRKIKELNRNKFKTSDMAKRLQADKRINFLKKIKGM